MQLTIAGFAGYMVAVFGVSGSANISLGWPWWLATPMALALATAFGMLGGALAVRTEGIYTIMITLAIGAAFYYFTNQNWAIFNGHTGINTIATPHFWGVDWRADIAFYYVIIGTRGAMLFRGALYLARAFWPRAAGRARQSAPNGRARLQCQRSPRCGLRVCVVYCSARRRAPGLELPADFARLDRGRTLHRHPDHRRGRRHTRPVGPFIGAFIFVMLRTFALDFLVKVGLDGNRFRLLIGIGFLVIVFWSSDGVIGLWESWRRNSPKVKGAAREAIVMDSVTQRISAAGAGAALELRGVTRMFGALAALTDVTITVRPGERRAVLGSNGAGKTTLFNCVTGDFPPSSGTIRFFGEDITRFPPYERIRRGLRRTYQISALFPGLTVQDNVYLACCGVSRGRFSPLRPRPNDALMHSADLLIEGVHLTRVKDAARLRARARTTASARDRSSPCGRTALYPVRRAGGWVVADGTARADRNPDLAACTYRLHYHRARYGRGAARGRERHDDAQRQGLQGRSAEGDRIRSGSTGALSRGRT